MLLAHLEPDGLFALQEWSRASSRAKNVFYSLILGNLRAQPSTCAEYRRDLDHSEFGDGNLRCYRQKDEDKDRHRSALNWEAKSQRPGRALCA